MMKRLPVFLVNHFLTLLNNAPHCNPIMFPQGLAGERVRFSFYLLCII